MVKPALKLSKAEDVFIVSYRGYPVGGLLRFHSALGLTAALLAVPMVTKVETSLSQFYFSFSLVLLCYSLGGYILYLPFAALGGRVLISPQTESITFDKSLLSFTIERSRQIPWEGTLETEVERVGWKMKFLPFHFFRVKVVTDFMTYRVATFGPGLQSAAEDMAKAIKQARYGRKNSKETSKPS